MDAKTKKALKVVFDYLAVSDVPAQADAIFLATSFSLDPPKKAAELLKKGYSDYIVMVGIEGTFETIWSQSKKSNYSR